MCWWSQSCKRWKQFQQFIVWYVYTKRWATKSKKAQSNWINRNSKEQHQSYPSQSSNFPIQPITKSAQSKKTTQIHRRKEHPNLRPNHKRSQKLRRQQTKINSKQLSQTATKTKQSQQNDPIKKHSNWSASQNTEAINRQEEQQSTYEKINKGE